MNFNYVEGVGRMASRGRGGRGGEGIRTVECGNLLTSTEERGRSQNTTPIGGLKTHSGMRNAESVMASAQPISFSGFFFFCCCCWRFIARSGIIIKRCGGRKIIGTDSWGMLKRWRWVARIRRVSTRHQSQATVSSKQ